MFRKLRSKTQPDRVTGGDNHRGKKSQKVDDPGHSRTYLVPKITAGRPQEYAQTPGENERELQLDGPVQRKENSVTQSVTKQHAKCQSKSKDTNSLPLYRGKKFELLSPGELKDTMSYCLYCSRKLCNPSSRFSHLLGQHHQEHYKNIINCNEGVMNAYEMGKPMNLTSMQQEAYVMSTLETAKVQAGTPLDRIHNDIVFHGKKITPTIFSMLLNMVKIRDEKFAHILRILSHGCNALSLNAPDIVNKFFQSDHFFQQFLNTNMIVDEIWLLRKEYPEKNPEWKIKHRHILKFRSKLLKFLEKQFGRDWAQNLKDRAEMQRVRVWPLPAGAGD